MPKALEALFKQNPMLAKGIIYQASAEASLYEFIKLMWEYLEPGREFRNAHHLQAMCEHLEAVSAGQIKKLLINIPPGFAKALDVDTPILTTWGWKRHGDLKSGDFVFGPDGKPKRVVGVKKPVIEGAYDIVFDDGSSVVAGEGHLWEVERDYNKTPRKREKITVTTGQLISSQVCEESKYRGYQRPDCIAITSAIEMPPKRLLIDPYTLGAWLGDGASAYGAIYSCDNDVHIYKDIGKIRGTVKAGGPYKQDFHRVHVDGLTDKLNALGLKNNKHIPEDYLEASVEQRWELLRGLMDTDGTVSKEGACSFCNANAILAIELHHLIQSLGIKSHIRSRYTKLGGRTYGPHYHINFTPNDGDIVFKMKRKQDRVSASRNARKTKRYISQIIPVGKRRVNCIHVEGGLYLAGLDLITTHNSITVNVFWPAWEWITNPHFRYLTFSYASSLTERDNGRFATLIRSDLYRVLWGDSFVLTKDNQVKVENNRTGWKIASSVGGTGTGERGNRIIIDDANNIKDVESKTTRDETNRWYLEVLPSRVIDPNESVFVNIQQRSNEDDVSGLILARDMGYEHLCLPHEFDPDRKCVTSIGWEDWRTDEGELLWPEVYDENAVARLKSDREMSSYAWAGQHQQSPAPRGGGIIKSAWWNLWPKQGEVFDESGNPTRALEYPVMDFIIVSVDPAFTEKRSNDYSAAVVLGLYRDEGQPRVILMDAWQKRMSFHGTVPERRKGETRKQYLDREEWGLVELVAYTAHEMHADKVVVEKTASGIPLIQELIRLYSNEKFGVQGITPKGDKIARAHAVSNLFENGIIAAPNRWWAQLCIDEMSIFPRGKHDDLPDALIQGVKFLRDTGWALRTNEYEEEIEPKEFKGKESVLYDV